MTARWLLVVMLGACGTSKAPAPQEPAHSVRPTVARRELPAELAPLVPKHGALAVGGGVKSPVFRVIVDTDAKAIISGSAPAGSALGGKLTDEKTRELTPRNEKHLMQLCADAWSETTAQSSERVVGYDEFLIIADGEELFVVEGKGPITRPLAARAIEALRAAADL